MHAHFWHSRVQLKVGIATAVARAGFIFAAMFQGR